MNTQATNKKVLLVEDDEFISDIYQMKLGGEGLDMAVAMNGGEALALLEGGLVPDVILLDIVMPVMGGLEFLRHLRGKEEWKYIDVIMLTNLSDRLQVEECMSLGAKDYIVKSHHTPSEVYRRIIAVLDAQDAATKE